MTPFLKLLKVYPQDALCFPANSLYLLLSNLSNHSSVPLALSLAITWTFYLKTFFLIVSPYFKIKLVLLYVQYLLAAHPMVCVCFVIFFLTW